MATSPAPASAPEQAPRLIRRYPNRKLYDVHTSAYVTLEDLAALVRAGETVRVLDFPSGDDLTAQTLTQVILDEGKRGPSLLPTDLLHSALRRGGRALDAGRGAVGSAVGGALGGAIGAVDQIKHGVDGLLHQGIGRLARVLPTPAASGARADELDALRQQLADVERTLATLVRHQQSPQPTPPAVAPAESPNTPDSEPSA